MGTGVPLRRRSFMSASFGAWGEETHQSREEGHSQMPEVIVQQSAVHHVPEDSNASWLTQRVSCGDTKAAKSVQQTQSEEIAVQEGK